MFKDLFFGFGSINKFMMMKHENLFFRGLFFFKVEERGFIITLRRNVSVRLHSFDWAGLFPVERYLIFKPGAG